MAASMTWKLAIECATHDSQANPTRVKVPTQTLAPDYYYVHDEQMVYGETGATVELGLPSTLMGGYVQHLLDTFVVLDLAPGGTAAYVTCQAYYGVDAGTPRDKAMYFTLTAARPRAIAILPGDSSGVAAVYPSTTTRRIFTLTSGDSVRLRAMCNVKEVT